MGTSMFLKHIFLRGGGYNDDVIQIKIRKNCYNCDIKLFEAGGVITRLIFFLGTPCCRL